MKIRYRLFLWIGGLFLIAFVLSLYLENLLTTNSLLKATQKLREKILAADEAKRQHMEEFLELMLSEDLALIDTLLVRVTEFENVRNKFEPSATNIKNGTWQGTIDLLLRNKWADLIQTTANGTLLSMVMPEAVLEESFYRASPREGIMWIYQELEGKIQNPFLGLKVLPTAKYQTRTNTDQQMEVYLLCGWKTLLQYSPEIKQKLAIPLKDTRLLMDLDSNLVLAGVSSAVDAAYSYLQEKANEQDPNWIEEEIQKSKKNFSSLSEPPSCTISDNRFLNHLEKVFMIKNNKIFLMAGLVDFFSIPAFGGSPFSPLAPQGIVQFYEGVGSGKGILSQELISILPMLYGKKEQNTGVSSSCFSINVPPEIFVPAPLGRVFIGNSLKLSSDHENSFLSLAVDTDRILLKLALVLRQTAFIVHNNTVTSVFSAEGKKIDSTFFDQLPLEKMVQTNSGIVPCGSRPAYYLKMTPFPSVDLHFFAMTPEEKAFYLVKDLNVQTKNVIHRISFGLRMVAIFCLVIVLVALHKLSKKMTRPITLLANATEKIGAGKFEEASLPEIPESRHDEIATLYHSFAQMVKGLVEKERVKGILNKVVSREIAQEILKGEVHLGGEEKVVTVLFADIRDFTGMTEKMAPHEVIDLLNKCMTKVSHEIDQCGGVIDKYVGDEVMALFGAPLSQTDSALKAIYCALRMKEILQEWNNERKKQGLTQVEMGIGIHTGLVVAGNMGAENRLNYTVLGSNVNLAARLCSSAERMEILISEHTLNEPGVKEKVKVEEKGSMALKGFEKEVKVYKVIGLLNVSSNSS